MNLLCFPGQYRGETFLALDEYMDDSGDFLMGKVTEVRLDNGQTYFQLQNKCYRFNDSFRNANVKNESIYAKGKLIPLRKEFSHRRNRNSSASKSDNPSSYSCSLLDN